ncbi:MAG: DASS family sodium-coupled anion symporter [Acidobacteriota bacterium]
MEHSKKPTGSSAFTGRLRHALRWGAVVGVGLAVVAIPPPSAIPAESWRLLAIFAATIAGLIVQPLPGGALVLLSIAVIALTGTASPDQALAGFGDPLVWLVLAAFFMSRGMIKTGLGRRIALLFIHSIGHTSLGLVYALVATDGVLAMIIPSNAARSGGILFPIVRSLAEAYDSRPGPTANRLGAFLMTLVYQGDVILCAMFLTGQASNVLIASFAERVTGIELTYTSWALGAVVPGLLSLLAVPLLIYRLFPPEIRRTPAAAEFARKELDRLGPMSRGEKLMLAVFGLVTSLWLTTAWHSLDYSVVALVGICVLLLTGVLDWGDILAERSAWDVFIWYGGLVQMAKLLGDSGVTRWFAEVAAAWTQGWHWWLALAILLLVYFYAHYGFASITAHATAMYLPFLVVILAAGAPRYLAVLSLAYLSNLQASLTHYGTTPAPIYFGAGYVSQGTWWRLGFLVSIPNILIWTLVGCAWWKVLGWW